MRRKAVRERPRVRSELAGLDLLDLLKIVGEPIELAVRRERRRQQGDADRMIAEATGRPEKDVRAGRRERERANKKSKFAP